MSATEPIPQPNRVSTGVPGLDRMLRNGLIPGRPYLVTGASGSGKTTLGLQFLLEGIRREEAVLLVAVDEPPYEIMENVNTFGWDLSRIHTLDANPGTAGFRRLGDVQEIKSLHDVKSMQDLSEKARRAQTSEEVSIQSIYLKLRKQMETVHFQRVVIDSMTSIRHFALRQGEDLQAERTEIQSLLRFLSEQGATTLVMAQPTEPDELTPEEILCRGSVVLTKEWTGHSTRRAIQVSRFRGSAHDADAHPFTIGPDGIRVEVGGSTGTGR